ncbi:hypothetical protein MVES1_002745 [Malassezia vespertilionis]|uniref:Mediator of RNA polymerase II transcription subunit 13 n=1 Tax=Malassezia vespertilionis TaxID=2020962 RepID=A0A2N1JA09_9BASI|nr:uncharacterized protein MVES1_002745 [Malassezia vespertilionis]PKI83390.1 hypothetical protein MVES_002592 [Malassezia vespertilionis]WFD07381.1 hypothetical protein MVES1_002745 [Malassezia vespertilionis]
MGSHAGKSELGGGEMHVRCAFASAHISSRVRQVEYCVLRPAEKPGGPDLLAGAARALQAAQMQLHAGLEGENAPCNALKLLEQTWLYAIESTPTFPSAPASLWVFGAHDPLDHAGLRETERGTLTAPQDGLEHSTAQHAYFLRAIENAIADMRTADPHAERGVRCGAGVLLVESTPLRLLEFHAHTTLDTLVVRMDAHSVPWMPLAMQYDPDRPCSAPPVRPGESQLVLLPTLVHATYLDVFPGAISQNTRLADALAPVFAQRAAHDTMRVMVRIPVQHPPAMPMDTMDMGLDTATGTLAVTLLWPAALCLCLPAPPAPKEREPLGALCTLSVAALLRAMHRAPSAPLEAAESVVRSHSPRDEEEDVFQGIGQLTEDDFRFFGEPVDAAAAPPPVQAHAPAASHASPLGSPHETPIFAAPTPRASKYDVHGKLYTPLLSRKRRASGELALERRVVPRISPYMPADTPQVPVHSPLLDASESGSGSEKSEKSDAPALPFVSRAVALVRLQCSTWVAHQGALQARPCSGTRLEWAAHGAPRPIERDQCAPAAWGPLESVCVAVANPVPRFLLGCQRAVVQVCPTALDAWATLGLEPVGGPKRICVCAVLLGDMDPLAVRQWLTGLEHAYVRLRMGTLCASSAVLAWQDGQLVNTANGTPTVLANAWGAKHAADTRAICLLHAPDTASLDAAEHLYKQYRAAPSVHAAHAVLALPRDFVQPAWRQDFRAQARIARVIYDAVPRAGRAIAHTLALAPGYYAACKYLRAECAMQLAWPPPLQNVLQHGAVLHVAYDVVPQDACSMVRVVGIDDRAQCTFVQTWASQGTRADVRRIWEMVRAQMRTAPQVAWNSVVCRFGAMPMAESEAWAVLGTERKRDAALLDTLIACVERGAPLHMPAQEKNTLAAPLHAVFPTERMVLGAKGEQLLALQTAYVAQESTGAWTVHLLHAFFTAQERALDGYMHDLVLHLGALQYLATARWPLEAPLLPWHVAVLAAA